MVRINALAHFVNHYKIATSKKNLYFDVRTTARSYPLLELFHDLNLVRRFSKISPQTYRVYPNYSLGRARTRRLHTFFRSNHYLTIPLTVLRIIDRNLPSSYLILETSQGIITHQEALKRKISGRLIIRLY